MGGKGRGEIRGEAEEVTGMVADALTTEGLGESLMGDGSRKSGGNNYHDLLIQIKKII